MTLEEMIARQQALVDTARAAGRTMTREENDEFNGLQGKIDTMRQAAPGAAGQPAGDPPAGDPPAGENRGAGGQAAPGAAGQPPADPILAERQRMMDIAALCRQTGMEPDQYIRDGATMDTVRAAAVTHMIQNGAPVSARMNEDQGDNFRSAAADAMLMRAGVSVEQPTQGADQMRGMTMRDLAIECMAREGVGSTTSLLRMSKDDLFALACRQFFSPTAAFPAILDNAIKKAIVQKYQEVPTTFQTWTGKGSVADFKPTKDHSYLAGGTGEFLLVGENGELKHDNPKTDLLPQRKIDTYGRQFSMSRQAFINDDVGFITEMPGMYAASAKRTINKQVYQILVNNPAIFDGVSLFDTAHGNLVAAGTKPSNEAIQKMMMKMLLQKDPFGEAIMVQPSTIIVPVGYKFLMTTILSSPTINTPDNTQAVNPLYQYKEQLQIVEEGTINALAGKNAAPWFMVGDKSYAKNLQVDYLNGQETPTIRRSEVPGQLGYVWDIWLDWGITALDFRGIARNNGVAITE
ncbi:MAG: hypothetical protein RR949_00645 [Oscillospiraceae bacterium]